MIKLAALSALALTTALVALPAAAADLRVSPNGAAVVRVSLAGKTSVQIQADLKAAADTVCAAQRVDQHACAAASLRDANSQLKRINPGLVSAKPTKLFVARDDKSVIRVAVAGKSEIQLSAEINTAAETVCKVSTRTTFGANFRACVDGAVKDANAQLRELAQARPQLQASL